MSDEFHLGSGNWWDSTRNRLDNTQPPPPPSVSSRLNASAGGSMAVQNQSSPNLQMMGLGLSSQANMDWNQPLFRAEKSESSFRSMLQEDSSTSNNFLQESSSSHEQNWRQRLYASSEDHQPQFSSQANCNDSSITSHSLNAGGYQVDSAAAYGLLMPDGYPNYPASAYGHSSTGDHQLMPSWNKFPQFKSSPPKNPLPAAGGGNHLHFTNNTPFWNASAPVNDARSGFFPALQPQIPVVPSFDERPKNTSEVRELGTMKKNNAESSSNKRSRNEMTSQLPACNKVKKEKMGDRITALQQLVSPFGKTDTASVLSEAFDYIKFLHEQVSVLSTPYMKNGAHQQIADKSKDPEGARQDLRSRGLCLVPVSSTFPVTQETTVDFWTPTFGGTFR